MSERLNFTIKTLIDKKKMKKKYNLYRSIKNAQETEFYLENMECLHLDVFARLLQCLQKKNPRN
jgi:hypothetical protein